MIDTQDLNVTMPRRSAFSDKDEEFLRDFLPKTSPDLHARSASAASLRHCAGKKQRSGKREQLECHKIDLDALSPFHVNVLTRFVSSDSEILPKSQTGLCSKCQRKVAKTIKHSRNLGLMPHIDEYIIRDEDSRSSLKGSPFHHHKVKGTRSSSSSSSNSSSSEDTAYVSKTIL